MANADAGPALEPAGLTMPVPVDLHDATARLVEAGERFGALVESIAVPDAPAHGLDWSVAETAVHVLNGLEYYAACIRGATPVTTPRMRGETFAAFAARENQALIDAEPERDPPAIARRVNIALRDLVDAALDAGPDDMATFAAGYSEDTVTSVCTMISELVVHGYDIARTTGARWAVDSDAAALAVYGVSAGLPLVLDRDAAAGEEIHVKIRIRRGAPFSIRIDDGRVWTEMTHEKPDVTVWADPVAYLLVGFGRSSLLGQVARGKLAAWGRRPWTVLRVPKLLLSP